MSKLAEILLGKEKAMERRDTLSQLEGSIETSGDPKTKSLFKKLLDFELKMGKAIIAQGSEFVKEEKARKEKERQIGESPYTDVDDRFPEDTPEEDTSVFAPLFAKPEDRKSKMLARQRLNKIIKELQQLKGVV